MYAHHRSLTALSMMLFLLMLFPYPQVSAEDTVDPDIFLTNRSSIPIRLHRPNLDLATVERVQFWQTNDRGDTWLMVRDIEVTDQLRSQGRIGYTFRPTRDGLYGFRICVRLRDGSADPEPRSGQRPAAADMILIDTTPPEVVRFTVEAIASDDPDPLRLLFRVSWAIRDLHPGPQPATIEWSDQGEQWHPLATDLAVHGRHQINPPTSSRFLRLRARDAAGNETLSDLATIPWPETPASQETELEPPPIPDRPSPVVVAETSEQDASATKPSTETAAPGSQLPSRDELLAAAGRSAAAEPTRQAENLDAYLPVAPVVPADHQDIIEPFKDRQRAGSAPPAPVTQHPTSQDPPSPPVREIPPTTSPQEQTALTIPDREETLRVARELTRLGSLGDAQRHYRSLRGTSVSRQALPEEMAVLRRLGRADEALAIYRVAPAHDLSDGAHLMRALALIDLGRAAESILIVDAIGDHSPHYREARFIRGLALHRLGDTNGARTQMQILSAINDSWGNLAASWLQRHRGP